MKQYSILFCLLLALAANSSTIAKAQVDVNDSLALVDLYNSTNGPGWFYNINWLTTNPVSTWNGISLEGTRVRSISLSYNQLSGPLPSSIGNLTSISVIALTNNQLSGSIPPSVGNLSNLDILDLNNNQLSGSIPSSIGNMSKISYLELGLNQLSGPIPASIGNLINLNYLSFRNNQLSGTIPASIGHLVNLYSFRLNNNQLSGEIPHTFKKLKTLTIIDLSYNQLSQNSNIRKLFGEPNYLSSGRIYNNLFTFDGLEFVAQKFPFVNYTPQATIPVHRNGNVLSVYAGGRLSKNTYYWFKAGENDSTTIKGDSTFTPTEDGKYYAKVTNAIATQLTLYSDTIDYTANSLTVNNRLSADANRSKIKKVFQVFPNPASNTVNVWVKGTVTIIFTNSSGKVLLTKAINSKGELNVSTLANGVYYIQNRATREVQKIVVAH